MEAESEVGWGVSESESGVHARLLVDRFLGPPSDPPLHRDDKMCLQDVAYNTTCNYQ